MEIKYKIDFICDNCGEPVEVLQSQNILSGKIAPCISCLKVGMKTLSETYEKRKKDLQSQIIGKDDIIKQYEEAAREFGEEAEKLKLSLKSKGLVVISLKKQVENLQVKAEGLQKKNQTQASNLNLIIKKMEETGDENLSLQEKLVLAGKRVECLDAVTGKFGGDSWKISQVGAVIFEMQDVHIGQIITDLEKGGWRLWNNVCAGKIVERLRARTGIIQQQHRALTEITDYASQGLAFDEKETEQPKQD